MRDAKILGYDLEVSTTRIEIEAYGLKVYDKYHNHKNITREYALHGAAWKWLGEPARCISVSHKSPFHDEFVVKTLHAEIEKADILVGHNIDAFDIKKFNTRALHWGLPPIGKKQTVDTLKLARKHFAFESNSLSYLSRKLGIDAKESSPDWAAIREGCPEALEYMRYYNRRDVEVAEQLYLKLRSYADNHPTVGDGCKVCGSHNLVNNGLTYRNHVQKQRMKCTACGYPSNIGKKHVA